MKTLQNLWNDDAGVTYTIEVVLVATIAGLGLVVGMTTLRDSVTNELADVAGAVDSLVQSYQINGITGHSSSVNGSQFTDLTDYCDNVGDTAAQADQCIVHIGPSQEDQGNAAPAL